MPLDWDRPKGRTISLALIRNLASKPDERIGTAFINPGGPGDTGLGLLTDDPEGIDAIGGGRFDIVSWDPRGTNASTRVRCFRNPGSEERFWAGASIPLARAASERSRRRSVALARRCGRVRGWLLPHISTADTARDMDHLRELVGEEKLTYIGLSYGSYLGQTYANMFPNRVRAMLLNGLVDAPRYAKSAEARAALWVGAAERVFGRFLTLCDSAGPERCALAGGRPYRGRAGQPSVRAAAAWPDSRSRGASAPLVAGGTDLCRSVVFAVPAAQVSEQLARQRGGSRRRAAG